VISAGSSAPGLYFQSGRTRKPLRGPGRGDRSDGPEDYHRRIDGSALAIGRPEKPSVHGRGTVGRSVIRARPNGWVKHGQPPAGAALASSRGSYALALHRRRPPGPALPASPSMTPRRVAGEAEARRRAPLHLRVIEDRRTACAIDIDLQLRGTPRCWSPRPTLRRPARRPGTGKKTRAATHYPESQNPMAGDPGRRLVDQIRPDGYGLKHPPSNINAVRPQKFHFEQQGQLGLVHGL